MCGLIGYLTKESHKGSQKRAAMFESALDASKIRGKNATGIAVVRHGSDECDYVKRAMPASDFVNWKGYAKLMDDPQHLRLVMGHTRAATDKYYANANNEAHPFAIDHITLAHNGFVSNHHDLDADVAGINVDSSRAACAIAKYGESVALPMFDGSYALTWYNSQDKTFNIARNEGRPLYFVEVVEEDTIWWASEHEMLHWFMRHYGYSEKTKWKLPTPHKHLKFDIAQKEAMKVMPYVFNKDLAPRTAKRIEEDKKRAEERASFIGPAGSHARFGGTRHGGTGVLATLPAKLPAPPSGGDSDSRNSNTEKISSSSLKPSQSRRLKVVAEQLRHIGLEIDRVVGVKLDMFREYGPKQELGEARGRICLPMEADPIRPTRFAMIPNVSLVKYMTYMKDGTMICRIVNLRREANEENATVVCEFDPILHHSMYTMKKSDDKEIEMVRGPDGVLITVEEFKRYTKEGCANCVGDIFVAQADTLSWQGDSPLCASCTASGIHGVGG